jgi:hypothetical protein
LLIAGLQSEAELPLQHALEILLRDATILKSELDPTQLLKADAGARKSKLSSAAIDLLIEERLRQAEESCAGEHKAVRRRGRRHVGELHPDRQRAIMLMIESLSLLDKLDDLEAVTYLQLAIDLAMQGCSAPPESTEKQQGLPRPN